jgi:hypothetical protein
MTQPWFMLFCDLRVPLIVSYLYALLPMSLLCSRVLSALGLGTPASGHRYVFVPSPDCGVVYAKPLYLPCW